MVGDGKLDLPFGRRGDVVERGVEGAVRVEADDHEVGIAPVPGAGDDDLAVVLDGDGAGSVVAAEVVAELSVAAEGGIGGAVGVEAGDGDVVGVAGGCAGVGVADGDDLAVGLQGDGGGAFDAAEGAGAEGEVRPAVATERCVEGAVGVVADQGEVGGPAVPIAGDDGPAVGLDGHRTRGVRGAEVGELLAVGAEVEVQLAGDEEQARFERFDSRR